MSPLEARTVPAGQAPPSNGGRHGRPFTLRVEQGQEDTLRREMARLELLPYDKRPSDLFGWDAGGGGGRRRQSFGWFMLWAALQWARHHDGQGGLRLRAAAPGKAARGSSLGKTRGKRRGAKRAGRKPAKRAKKGGRR